MIDFDTDTNSSGPVFDQRGPHYMTRAADDGSKEVARYAQRQIIAFLEGKMRHPTGHYVSTVNVVREGPGWKVDGNGTVYGRWLEGIDSRQLSGEQRKFKGYRAFRTITQRVRTRVVAVAWPAIRPWIRRLGGS